MDTRKMCSGCQKPLAPNAPDGLCPACLMKAGVGTGVDVGPDSQDKGGHASFAAPTPDELVQPFPQLEILSFIGQDGIGAVYKARQIQGTWEEEPHGRRGARRCIYRLTIKGKRQLAKGREEWASFVRVIGAVMGAPACTK